MRRITTTILTLLFVFQLIFSYSCSHRDKNYTEITIPTSNIGEGRNEVIGIILHHTASNSIKHDLESLCGKNDRQVSAHALIDKDGTRYIFADPESITWHAGYSIFQDREKCNDFTIGIEFEGNTCESPLTKDQIKSAIEYIIPILEKYHIPLKNITTHEKVRKEWLEKYPDLATEREVPTKADITQDEYSRFMKKLTKVWKKHQNSKN